MIMMLRRGLKHIHVSKFHELEAGDDSCDVNTVTAIDLAKSPPDTIDVDKDKFPGCCHRNIICPGFNSVIEKQSCGAALTISARS